jgi:hypothetical protein
MVVATTDPTDWVTRSMETQAFTVRARWDGESRTWWTDGEDIPGLCCQATTFESLVETILGLAPELLVANGLMPADAGDVPITITAERHGTARLVA